MSMVVCWYNKQVLSLTRNYDTFA